MTTPDTTMRARMALVTMSLLVVAVWMLQHPYTGIMHDATLYTLFALSRLHPAALDGDVFLRFGSQDGYTLFTPIYAAAISLLGLERAASLLTLIFHGGLFLSAWLLGRRFMPPLTATLGVALLVAAPGEYGSSDVFHIVEGFISPRVPAEALVVGGLAAALSQRHWLAACCVVAAMSLHPIIGSAGAIMLILTFVAPTRPRLVAAAGAVVLAAAVVTVLALAPLGRVTGTWLYTVRITSVYLFLANWSSNDWSRVTVPLAVLAIGMLRGTAPELRRLCAAGLVMVACGLLITCIFSDLLHVSIFISAQPWRWLWLANVIAFVLLPAIALDCWRRGDSGRTALMVLASAWIFRGTPPTLYLAAVAIACAAVPDRWTQHRAWRWLLLAASVLVGLALVLDLTDRLFYLPGMDPTVPLLVQKARIACVDGVIPGALCFAAWQLLRRAKSTARVAAIAVVAALTCVALLPQAWDEWTYSQFTPVLASRFAPWRAAVPAGAEILWPDTPVGSWYLLERPSYWSKHQSAGAIFSRDKALLLEHRNEALAKAVQASSQAIALRKAIPEGTSPMDFGGMKIACADPDLSYIVNWLPVAPTPYPPVAFATRKWHGEIYLYRCSDLRS